MNPVPESSLPQQHEDVSTSAGGAASSASSPPLLAIIVPTYNRAACLRLLLGTLEVELAGLSGRVQVLVSDNGSADDTPQVVREFERRIPGLVAIRHATNLGPDENFCRCVELVDADHFWIIGDDDLPRAGAIAQLLPMLHRHRPDLVNVRTFGRARLDHNDPQAPVDKLEVHALDRVAFARRVNVLTTFISGVIVRRDVFAANAGSARLRRYAGTHLVQLSWVLGTLAKGDRLFQVQTICMFAKSGNSGGYALLKVFGENFPAIVREQFGRGSAIAEAMISRYAIEYMSHLVWSLRQGQAGDFAREPAAAALAPQLGESASFPLLMAIATAPLPVARALRLACRIAARALRWMDSARSLFGRRTRVA
jgi:abequosyltransferase